MIFQIHWIRWIQWKICFIWGNPYATNNWQSTLITAHTTSVREGNVFNLSVHRGGPRIWSWTGTPCPWDLGMDRGTPQRTLALDRWTPSPPFPLPPHQNSQDSTNWAVHLWWSRWRSFLFYNPIGLISDAVCFVTQNGQMSKITTNLSLYLYSHHLIY